MLTHAAYERRTTATALISRGFWADAPGVLQHGHETGERGGAWVRGTSPAPLPGLARPAEFKFKGEGSPRGSRGRVCRPLADYR